MRFRDLVIEATINLSECPGGVIRVVRVEPLDAYALRSGLVGRVSLDFGFRELGVTDSYFCLRTIRDIKSQTPDIVQSWNEVAELRVFNGCNSLL